MKGFSIVPFSLFNATQILSIANLPYCSPDRSTIPIRNPNRGIPIHHQEHQNSGAEFSISSKKHQFFNHQRRGQQQIPKIGEKSERERKFNIVSKTACRGFKSFCPCHRHGSLQTPTFRRLRAFSMPKSSEWTRSIDTGFPWQNPPNAPIFVNIPTVAVWYIIKKASANFRKRTVLYRVPRMGKWRRQFMHLFCSTLL